MLPRKPEREARCIITVYNEGEAKRTNERDADNKVSSFLLLPSFWLYFDTGSEENAERAMFLRLQKSTYETFILLLRRCACPIWTSPCVLSNRSDPRELQAVTLIPVFC
jgi:hypothetical protein